MPGNKPARRVVSIGDMALTARLHPLLVHFPIALVLIAGGAEVIAILTWAAALVGVTGHLGGQLVWGADFLRP